MRTSLISITLALVTTLTLIACGSASSGPEGVVETFLKSAKAGNFDKAVGLYAPEVLEQPGAKEKLTSFVKAGLSQHDGVGSYTVGTAEVSENSAQVPYTITYKDGSDDKGSMSVEKIDGKWYLSVN
jgi:hypothetical protein